MGKWQWHWQVITSSCVLSVDGWISLCVCSDLHYVAIHTCAWSSWVLWSSPCFCLSPSFKHVLITGINFLMIQMKTPELQYLRCKLWPTNATCASPMFSSVHPCFNLLVLYKEYPNKCHYISRGKTWLFWNRGMVSSLMVVSSFLLELFIICFLRWFCVYT